MSRPAKAQNTALDASLKTLGFSLNYPNSHTVVCQGRLSSVLPFAEENSIKKLPWGINKNEAERKFFNENDEWVGGSLKQLQQQLDGKIDMTPFNTAREKFARSSIGEKLRENFANCLPGRKRIMSEYDGEWCEDRRWSRAPWQGVIKTKRPGRTIDLIAHMAVNYFVTAERLNDYGCLVWAIADILEASGVNCRIVFEYKSNRLWGNEEENTGEIQIECKKAGEYLAPSLLATVCQANFYRRVVFALWIACSDLKEKPVSYTLGRATTSQGIRFLDGKLELSPDACFGDYEKISQELLKALN